jgi:hypothetical protein
MFKFLPVLVFFLLPTFLFAQNSNTASANTINADTVNKTDLIDIVGSIINIKPRPTSSGEKKKIYFSILPFSTTGTNGALSITSTTAGFYLGDQHTTYLSTVNFTPYLNFQGRYGLPIRSSIWLKDNTFNIQGDTRLLVYPQYTWGLGGGQPADKKFLVDYKYLRFYQSAVKRITSYLYAGIGYNLDYYMDMGTDDGTNTTLRKFTNYEYGTIAGQNSFSSGPSVNLLYDSRNNSINPLPGWYGNLIYRISAKAWGSDDNWRSLYLDVRKYYSFNKSGPKNMLAFWGYYWVSVTPRTPYLNLPSIGMDPNQRSGRGVEQNRYRGESLLYFETEYRRDITNNGLLGYVLFANVNSAAQPNSKQLKYWNPAGGGGLRIKFNKKSDTNISIDYGFSRNYSSWSVNLGETF